MSNRDTLECKAVRITQRIVPTPNNTTESFNDSRKIFLSRKGDFLAFRDTIDGSAGDGGGDSSRAWKLYLDDSDVSDDMEEIDEGRRLFDLVGSIFSVADIISTKISEKTFTH